MAAPVTITFIPKCTGNSYFNGIVEGFQTGCKMLECEFMTVGPATAHATSQIPFVTEQLQRKADVIAIAPNSPIALRQVLEQARREGTLVLSINSDLPGNQNLRDAAVLPVDFSRVGASQVELMGSLIQYEGEIAILSATADAPDQNAWIADMKRVLSQDPKYARMKLLTIAYGNDDPKRSTAAAEALVANHPKLRGIIAPTAVGLLAAAQVVGMARKAERIKVTGLGLPNQMRRFVESGAISTFQLWSPYKVGLLAAHFAVGVKQGKIKNKPGKSFNVPILEKVTIQESNILYPQAQLTTFNKENIDRFNF
jgi:rhamnose transport system substrate-binding protein